MRRAFGDFVFDSGTKELLRGGAPVTMSPKAFQLLELLIESAPTAVSKSDLHDRLWPDTFVVEANLPNLIGEIRRALSDDPRQPRYVRTIHRFGYAFRAEPTDLAPAVIGSLVCRVIWTDGSAVLRNGEHIVGRDPHVSVFLDSPSVSRRHARIVIDDAGALFEDLDSKNGSYIEGRRTKGPVPLANGDIITIGVIAVTFRVIQPAVPTQSVL